MANKFSDLKASMPPGDLAEAEAMTKSMMADMLLSEIRKHVGLTQEALATAVGIKQPALSQLESQDDMQISTLRRLIEGLGGRLELVAHLPDGEVRIGQFKTKAG